MSNVVLLLVLFILSLVGTWFYRKIAIKKKILDIPNDRSSHIIPTPRGGGVVITVIWFVGLSWLFYQGKVEPKLFWAFMSSLPLVVIGLIDDFISLKPSIRMVIQIVSAVCALFFLGGLRRLDFGVGIVDWVWLLTPVALIGFIWFINLYNFLDGIDGYASVEAISFLIFIYILIPDIYLLVLFVAVLGFLIWNWHPAKIFMGDVGSTLLGFNIVVIAIYYQNTEQVSLLLPIIMTGVFWFDATLTLFRRYKNKEKLSQAHKKHGYQRMVQSGLKHSQVTAAAFCVNILLAGLAFFAYNFSLSVLPVLLISIMILMFLMRYVDKRKSFPKD